MRFVGLSATEFTLLFSSAAFLAVVFYLISFRRRTAVLAAEPIWRLVLGRRRTPFRKLLALLVQILVLFLLSLPIVHAVVLLEERELRQRFGEAYGTYCEDVPRYVPRRR